MARIFLVIAFILLIISNSGFSEQASLSPFRTPPKLRARVDFWKDIFARYGKYHRVIHHRMYPQLIFMVLDFSDEAREMGAIRVENYIKEKENDAVQDVRRAFIRLAEGSYPHTALEKKIAHLMASIKGGDSKYRRVIEEDLIRVQTGIREKTEEAIMRSGRYLPFIEKTFVEHGLPVEVSRLPFVESSFNTEIVSSAGAVGLWQFMPSTAKDYGMRVDKVIDQRRDPLVSSRAAARYLKHAYNRLGSWPLAITSYNNGVSGVLKKMKESSYDDLADLIESSNERPFGFASNNFYTSFLAALEIYQDYRKYFENISRDPPLEFYERRITKPVSAVLLARELGLPLDDLKKANYALTADVWSGKFFVPTGFILRVPSNKGSVRIASSEVKSQMIEPPSPTPIEMGSSAIYGGAVHTVRWKDTLLGIAKKYNTTTKKLMEINQLKSSTLKVGQTIIVKERGSRTDMKKNKENSNTGIKPKVQEIKHKTQKPLEAKSYKVKGGDSLWAISKKFKVKVEDLKKLNKIGSSPLKPGQQILIP